MPLVHKTIVSTPTKESPECLGPILTQNADVEVARLLGDRSVHLLSLTEVGGYRHHLRAELLTCGDGEQARHVKMLRQSGPGVVWLIGIVFRCIFWVVFMCDSEVTLCDVRHVQLLMCFVK